MKSMIKDAMVSENLLRMVGFWLMLIFGNKKVVKNQVGHIRAERDVLVDAEDTKWIVQMGFSMCLSKFG